MNSSKTNLLISAAILICVSSAAIGDVLVVTEDTVLTNNVDRLEVYNFESFGSGPLPPEFIDDYWGQTTVDCYSHVSDFSIYDNSILNLRDGAEVWVTGGLEMYHDSVVNVFEGGVITDFRGGGIDIYDRSTLNVSGGTVGLFINPRDSSTINVYEGNISSVVVYDSSMLNFYGGRMNMGWMRPSYVSETATITIYGDDLVYDPFYHYNGGGGFFDPWWESRLTGIGFDGVAIDIRGLPDPATNPNIHLIPEPTTLVLLSAGVMLLRRRESKRQL